MNFFVIHLGYTSEKLPKKKILEVRELSATEAQDLGAPSGKEWDSLFGAGATKVYGIHFEAVKPEETQQTYGKSRKAQRPSRASRLEVQNPKSWKSKRFWRECTWTSFSSPRNPARSRTRKRKKRPSKGKFMSQTTF